ncbi:FHA domain-containing protein [Luteimonas sp. MC1750]|uniref:FHA domain-containing protein n=1 Tax=Luteimonas sp. MC1750 TaxID=2799326 RepID=UPI0019090E2A|nr:FHA domain-containing protein [Luteimonas sp. MC1750]QQO06512.1 FHA domain-containing protein [Luteimonas sp. MC1750]
MNSQLRVDPAPSPSAVREARGVVASTVVRPALPRFVLRGVSGAGFGRTFPLVGPTVLGRAPECAIHLDHPGISREHLRLTPTAEGLLVEDLGSTNGWLLNEVPQQRGWARHGDEIGIDVLRFRVVAPGLAPVPTPQAGTAPARTAGVSNRWWLAALAVLGTVAVLLLR